ncbi:pentapeptide repeat-containing protein, partial [Planobispora siamensis]
LARTNLTNTILVGTDLADADLIGVNLTGAIWEKGTLWPRAVKRKIRAASEPLAGGRMRVRAQGGPETTSLLA